MASRAEPDHHSLSRFEVRDRHVAIEAALGGDGGCGHGGGPEEDLGGRPATQRAGRHANASRIPADDGTAFPWDTDRWDGGLHDFVREAIRLRSTEPVLRHGVMTVLAAEGHAVVYERRLDERAMLIAVNAGAPAASVRVRASHWPPARAIERLAVGGARWSTDPDGSVMLDLDGRSGRILELTHD